MLDLGVAIPLVNNKLTSFYFSGLHFHGASAPRAPPGVKLSPTAIRWLVVMYPGRVFMDGDAIYVLAPKPNGTPLIVGPELRDAG